MQLSIETRFKCDFIFAIIAGNLFVTENQVILIQSVDFGKRFRVQVILKCSNQKHSIHEHIFTHESALIIFKYEFTRKQQVRSEISYLQVYRDFFDWCVGHFHKIQTLYTNTKFIYKTGVGGTAIINFANLARSSRRYGYNTLSTNAY